MSCVNINNVAYMPFSLIFFTNSHMELRNFPLHVIMIFSPPAVSLKLHVVCQIQEMAMSPCQF